MQASSIRDLFLLSLPWEHREFLQGDGIQVSASGQTIKIKARRHLARTIRAIADTLSETAEGLEMGLEIYGSMGQPSSTHSASKTSRDRPE